MDCGHTEFNQFLKEQGTKREEKNTRMQGVRSTHKMPAGSVSLLTKHEPGAQLCASYSAQEGGAHQCFSILFLTLQHIFQMNAYVTRNAMTQPMHPTKGKVLWLKEGEGVLEL